MLTPIYPTNVAYLKPLANLQNICIT